MAERKVVVVPNEDEFKPAPIPFAIVTGEGVDNYDGDGKEYTASIILNKKQAKFFRDEVLEFWEDNKPSDVEDEKPANWKNIVREGKDNYEGDYILYAKTQTHFGDKPNIVTIVNHEGTKLAPEEFGMIGKGSEGRLAVVLSVYKQGKGKNARAGVSVFLSAIKLTDFSPLESNGGAAAFGTEEGNVDAAGGFKKEGKQKDKKKKKQKD